LVPTNLKSWPPTENSDPESETVTNREDHLLLFLGDVGEGKAEMTERSEKSEKARAPREYMPVPLGENTGEAPGCKGKNLSPFNSTVS
jgi:hypothetical protein